MSRLRLPLSTVSAVACACAVLAGCATVDLSTPVAVSIEDRVYRGIPAVSVTRSADGQRAETTTGTSAAVSTPPRARQPVAAPGVVVEEVVQGNPTIRAIEPVAR